MCSSSCQSTRPFSTPTTPPLQHVLKAAQTQHAKLSRKPAPPQHPFLWGGAGLQLHLLQAQPPAPLSLLQTCPLLSVTECPSPAGYPQSPGPWQEPPNSPLPFTLPCPFQHPHSSQRDLLKALNTVTTSPNHSSSGTSHCSQA